MIRILKIKFRLVALFLLLIIGKPGFAQQEKVQLAFQYKDNAEYEKAAALFKDLYEANPLEYFDEYESCLEEIKDYKTAEKILKKQIKKNPQQLGLLVKLGNLYTKSENGDKAAKEFEKAIDNLSPDQQQAFDLAHQFMAFKQFDYAIKTLLRARELGRGMYPFSFELAEVYEAKGDYDAMITEYLEIIDQNEMFLQQVQNVMQTNIGDDPDSKKARVLKSQLLKRIQSQPDKTVFAEMLIWLFIQEKNFEQAFNQTKALDKRKKEEGTRIINLAQICISNQDYETATRCYEYVISLGKEKYYYTIAKMELVNVMNQKITRGNYSQQDLINLELAYESTLKELGRSSGTIALIKGLAHLQAYYLDKKHDAEINLEDGITMPNISPSTQAELKIAMADVLVMQGEVWESVLLYGQVEKAFKEDPIGHEAKFKSAKLSYYKGEFEWAQAQLDVLKASTSKLIANDALYLSLLIMENTEDSIFEPLRLFSRADLLFFQHKYEVAFKTLDSITTLFPAHALNDDILYKKAQIEHGRQNYPEAVKFLMQLIETYSQDILADDALFMLGDLYENKLNDKEKAKQIYQDLVLNHPGSLYVVDARKRYRMLRGDKIN